MAKTPTYIIENQQKFISYILHKVYDFTLNEKYVTDKKLNIIYKARKLLQERNLTFAFDELYNICQEIHPNVVDLEFIDNLFNAFDNFDNIDFVISQVKQGFVKNDLAKEILEDIVADTTQAGELKTDRLLELANKIYEVAGDLDDHKVLLSGADLAKSFIENIEDQIKNGNKRYTFGLKEIDKLFKFPAMPGEMTLFIGSTGSAKSSLALAMENSLINRGVPFFSINLEMTKEILIKKLCCIREGIAFDDLSDNIKDRKLYLKLMNFVAGLNSMKNYIFTDCPTGYFDLNALELNIIKVKRKFVELGVLKNIDDYMIVKIDLTSMLLDFSGQSGMDLEKPVNKLNEIAKKHNIHIINIWQANENWMRSGHSLNTPEKCDKFVLQMADVKGGSAIGERCRQVFSINRPLHLKTQYLSDEDKEVIKDDIDYINVQLIKSNNSKLGRAKFIFDTSNFRISPVYEQGTEQKN